MSKILATTDKHTGRTRYLSLDGSIVDGQFVSVDEAFDGDPVIFYGYKTVRKADGSFNRGNTFSTELPFIGEHTREIILTGAHKLIDPFFTQTPIDRSNTSYV